MFASPSPAPQACGWQWPHPSAQATLLPRKPLSLVTAASVLLRREVVGAARSSNSLRASPCLNCPSFANSPFIKIPPIIFLSMPSVSCWDPD